MFLLDGSNNTTNGFPQIKLFVKRIMESLFVSEGQVWPSAFWFSSQITLRSAFI